MEASRHVEVFPGYLRYFAAAFPPLGPGGVEDVTFPEFHPSASRRPDEGPSSSASPLRALPSGQYRSRTAEPAGMWRVGARDGL